jgi:N-acetyl-gamma-glutamyl-phosphate reductase
VSKTKVGIVNVTGYTGMELARLLSRHPAVELTSVTGRSAAGKRLSEVFPHLSDIELTIEAELGEADFAFAALPHKESAAIVGGLLERGLKVVDLSADFRLNDAREYPQWYGFDHPWPKLLGEAIYGLPELYRQKIAASRLVANPGCYPTAALLALAPVVKNNLIEGDVIIDAKSGVSGAGRGLSLGNLFCEASEDTAAYALGGHRHLPEIVQELKLMQADFAPNTSFVPHLVPMARGILATCYATLKEGQSGAELKKLYGDFYKDEPFVRVSDEPPHTKQTRGSNYCLVHPVFDRRSGRLVIISCLDNLVKGAAGQAIQNMNIMLGIDEATGLEAAVVFP